MILEQLEYLRPQRRPQPRLLLRKYQKTVVRDYRKIQRHARLALRRQYYIWNAWSDARTAARHNEDIVIASLIIIGVLSFGLTSGIADAVLTFMLAASLISIFSGIDMTVLALTACAVMATLGGWAVILQQNMLALALYQGSTRKRYRSLRHTFRASLQTTPGVTIALCTLSIVALTPPAIVTLALASAVYFYGIDPISVYPMAGALGIAAVVWLGYALTTYALVPYVTLFERSNDLRATFARSRTLVRRKGRPFIVAAYACFVSLLALAYGVAFVLNELAGLNMMITFLCAACIALTILNVLMTMAYRKRRLARA